MEDGASLSSHEFTGSGDHHQSQVPRGAATAQRATERSAHARPYATPTKSPASQVGREGTGSAGRTSRSSRQHVNDTPQQHKATDVRPGNDTTSGNAGRSVHVDDSDAAAAAAAAADPNDYYAVSIATKTVTFGRSLM